MGTIALSEFHDDQGRVCRFTAEYNDGNQRITRVICQNDTGQNARVTLIDPATAEIVAQRVFVPGSTSFNVAGERVVVSPEGVNIPYTVSIQFGIA